MEKGQLAEVRVFERDGAFTECKDAQKLQKWG